MRYETTARDFFYETSGATALTYYITCDDVPIYNGTAVKSPDKPVLRINVGRRVSDYVKVSMPDFRNDDGVSYTFTDQLKIFNLYDGEGTLLETYKVLYEFTGEWEGEETVLNELIDGKADPRQKIFISNVRETSGYTDVGYPDTIEINFEDDIVLPSYAGSTDIVFTTNSAFTGTSESDWFNVSFRFAHTGSTYGIMHIEWSGNTGEERIGYITIDQGVYIGRNCLYRLGTFNIPIVQKDSSDPTSGVPSTNEIWVNKEAHLENGNWFITRDHQNSGVARIIDIYDGQHMLLNGLGYQIIEMPTHKIIRFPYSLTAFGNLAFNEDIKDMRWVIFPSAFSNTDVERVGTSYRLFPYNRGGANNGKNLDLETVTFMYSRAWQDCYRGGWGPNEHIFTDFNLNDDDLFNTHSLSTVKLPENLSGARLNYDSFRLVEGLESLYVPDGFTKIGGDAFYDCHNLVSLSLPNTLVSVGEDWWEHTITPHQAIRHCDLLTEITYRGTISEFKHIAYYNYLADPGVVVHCTDGDYTIVSPT